MTFMTSVFTGWLLPICYFLGFLPPVFARSWRALGLTFVFTLSVQIVLFAILLNAGGVLVLLTFFVVVIAAGSLSGHVTAALLLYQRWPLLSGKTALALLSGILTLPAFWSGHAAYSRWQTQEDYAALPSATTLPQIAECNGSRSAGPLLTAELLPAENAAAQTLPSSTTALSYPAAYMLYPPRAPLKVFRTNWINFEMGMPDLRPIPHAERFTADGNEIIPSKRPPSIAFHFLSRFSMPKIAWRKLRIQVGLPVGDDQPFDLKLVNSSYPSLQEMKTQTVPPSLNDAAYVHLVENRIHDVVQCQWKARVSYCEFSLDESGIPVDGYFPASQLGKWHEIEADIRSFTRCSVEAAKIKLKEPLRGDLQSAQHR